MKIGILQTGDVNEALVGRYGEYPGMFERLLLAADPDLIFENWHVVGGQPLPETPGAADGWLVTGSKHGVYDDLPWIEPLAEFLRGAHEAGSPIAGVCFGHQILAHALGGVVVKSDKGWGLGPQTYHVDVAAPWMEGAGERVAMQAIHQDQVVTPPPGATVLASSEFCPYAAFAYGETAFSVQAHPEFEADFTGDLLRVRRGDPMPETTVDEALAQIDTPLDSPQVGRWITAFFRQAQERRQSAAQGARQDQ